MKKIILITMLLIGSLFIITGCGKEENYTIVGGWKKGSTSYIFNEDGSCQIYEGSRFEDCTYTYTEDVVSISHYINPNDIKDHKYRIKGNKLYLTNIYNQEEEFKRIEK